MIEKSLKNKLVLEGMLDSLDVSPMEFFILAGFLWGFFFLLFFLLVLVAMAGT